LPAPALLGLVAWITCALFGFWLAVRAVGRREQVGRVFVGVGALLMAVSTAVPTTGPLAPPVLLVGILIALAGVFLLAGLILAYPDAGLRSSFSKPADKADESSANAGASGESPPDDDSPGRG